MSHERRTHLLFAILGSAIVTCGFAVYGVLCRPMGEPGRLGSFLYELSLSLFNSFKFSDLLSRVCLTDLVLAALSFMFFLFLFDSMLCGRTKWLAWLKKRRYWIGALFVVFCVLFELNNTSLPLWSDIFGYPAESSGLLYGMPHHIRSDEWIVWSPMALSQETLGYPEYNTLIGGGSTSTYWVSVGGLPAWNLAAWLKPFYWGFLLLGSAKGLSFLFAMRVACLFLVSFEMGEVVSRKKAYLSFAYAVLLTLSPYVQWWFSQSISEVLIFAQLMLLLWRRMLGEPLFRKRFLLACGFGYAFGCYLMIAYIAWLVGVLWMVAAAMLGWLIQYRKRLPFQKRDLLCVAPLVLAVCWVGLLALRDMDTLGAVARSAYPGGRVITGGSAFADALTIGYAAVLYPVNKLMVPHVEIFIGSGFLSLCPLGLLYALWRVIRYKERNPVLLATLAVYGFLLCFLCVGFPRFLAKLTLLSNCPQNRLFPLLGVLDAALLIDSLSAAPAGRGEKWGIGTAVVASALAVGFVHFRRIAAGQSMMLLLLLTAGGVTAIGAVLAFRTAGARGRRAFAVFCLITAILSGGMVNPVVKGVSAVTNVDLYHDVQDVGQADDLWLAEDQWRVSNFLLAAGKRSFASTQEYANVEKWAAVDAQGEYRDVYNRFCHIDLALTEGPTSFELKQTDLIQLNLSLSDLRRFNIRYLVTHKEYGEDSAGVRFRKLFTTQYTEFNIYELSYPQAGQ